MQEYLVPPLDVPIHSFNDVPYLGNHARFVCLLGIVLLLPRWKKAGHVNAEYKANTRAFATLNPLSQTIKSPGFAKFIIPAGSSVWLINIDASLFLPSA
jgi:hypothetical protein